MFSVKNIQNCCKGPRLARSGCCSGEKYGCEILSPESSFLLAAPQGVWDFAIAKTIFIAECHLFLRPDSALLVTPEFGLNLLGRLNVLNCSNGIQFPVLFAQRLPCFSLEIRSETNLKEDLPKQRGFEMRKQLINVLAASHTLFSSVKVFLNLFCPIFISYGDCCGNAYSDCFECFQNILAPRYQ